MKKLVLIDGNSLLNRAFYATPLFSTKSGMPTNGIFGFVKLLFKIIEDVEPDYLIVAFDLKAPTFRHKMYSEYKATRKGMPEELVVQVKPLKDLLKAMNIAMCSKEGLEADDIIGTLSKKFDVHSYIYTGDRDSYQLVDEKTDVYYTKRGVSDLLKLSISNFKEETGINPCQIIDLKALMGDKSDNIPGVPGVGEKTAYDLLAKYSSLDGIYENIDNLSGALKKKLSDNRELAYLSYKLATIDRNCELDIDIAHCVVPHKFDYSVKKMFIDFEFRSLYSLDIFEETKESVIAKRVYPVKEECSDYEDALKFVSSAHNLYIVLENSRIEIYDGNKILLLKYSEDLFSEGLSIESYFEILKHVFSDSSRKVTMFDCKAAMHLLKDYNIDFNCDYDDVSLVRYLVDYNSDTVNWGLKELCNVTGLDENYLSYAVKELFDDYFERLKADDLLKLYTDIEKPLLRILYDIEVSGVRVSSSILEELTAHYENYVSNFRQKIYAECGCEFNINSPSQLGEVLFSRLGINEVRKKKTGKYSTSAEILEKIEDKYPVVGYILKYRMYQKLYSTYLVGFKPLIDKNGLIHTTFNQTTTATGRLSSVNPNLQNIPIREDEGRELRKVFVPREGNVFIDADYSQIELRLLAHFSGCKELIDAYNNNKDIHAVTASQVFGVTQNEVTDKMRRAAKAVNFGIIYGISDFGLANNLNIPVPTAHEYIEKYFASYSAVKDYMNENVAFARKHSYVSTLAGRKRKIPEINSQNYNLRQFGERAAMNMPLQGSSADIIKIAMINVQNALKKEGLKTKLILQVHDELVLDAPEEEVERASAILKYEMENAVKLAVPLTVDVHTGKNWYDAK